MKLQAQYLCIVTLILCCVTATGSSDSDDTAKTPTVTGNPSPTTKSNAERQTVATGTLKTTNAHSNMTTHNATGPFLNGTLPDSWYGKNRGMLQRTLYVVLGITSIVIIYFGFRAWRTRRRRSKTRKYGLISTGADLEMEPLGNDMDDDDEDMTVFEQNGRRK